MILTEENYFTPENDYLSHSKIKDFLLSKPYFLKKHILKELPPQVKTPSMQIGSALDCLLTEGQESFDNNYDFAVLKKEDAEKFEELKTTDKTVMTKANYQKVLGMADALRCTDAFKDLAEFETQKILHIGS